LLIQGDGKIITAGITYVSATQLGFLVARFNLDGSIDTSFGIPNPSNPSVRLGYNTVSFVSGDFFERAFLQPDGKILVSGYTQIQSGSSSKSVMAVARFDADGMLDTAFGSGGKATIEFSSGSSARGIAVQSDGKIVLAGFSYFSLARLNPNGSLDSSFGTGGLVTTNPSIANGTPDAAWDVVIQRVPAVTGEERILVGGYAQHDTTTSNVEFALMRFRPNGTIDTTFGNSGRVNTDFSGFEDEIRNLVLDSNNRIVAVGNTKIADSQCGSYVSDIGVARYLENGNLDFSLNGTGLLHADFYSGQDVTRAVALQPDGRIVVVGWAQNDGSTITNFGLVRFNIDGSRDTSFGPRGDGVVGTDFYSTQTHHSYANSVALQADGKIVVGGTAEICTGTGKQACRSGAAKIALARYWP
jgi:uncharacterized delta-60 repeat protein